MHGGMKIYRGAAAAARHYVEADRSRADDYYLAEGSGVAMRFVAGFDKPEQRVSVERRADMDGDTYEQWVAGYDVETGMAEGAAADGRQGRAVRRGHRQRPEDLVAGGRAAPRVAAAYDAAQMAAAEEIIGWLASHATTRVGPRGRQVQVPVEQIEAAVVRHFTSRAGDPHRHLHLQINARVWAAGAWRGLHTVGVRDSLEAINGIGHAAVMTNPEFRAALAEHGYTLDPETGEVTQLAEYTGRSALGRDRSRRTSTGTRRSGGVTTPARSQAPRSGRRGTAERGPTPGPTRSSRSRERICATAGSRSSSISASEHPDAARPSDRDADRLAGSRCSRQAGRRPNRRAPLRLERGRRPRRGREADRLLRRGRRVAPYGVNSPRT